ncbi:hypothetical protein ACIPLC_16035 [Kitasatospora sp. NPDC086801]
MIVSPLNTARFPVPLEWGVPLSVDALGEVELCASEVIANALVHT